MKTTNLVKVTLRNTFHGSHANVIGERVEADAYYGETDGRATVRISASQVKRAGNKLCGISTCCCGNHGPSFEQESHDEKTSTYLVTGEIAK